MSREEQYFPRGKVAALPGTSSVKLPKRKDTEDLFKVLNSTKKKKIRKSKASDLTDDVQDGEELIIEPLTHKTIQQGMVLVGIVHYVQENNLRVALPGCVAQLPLNQLSNSYNNLLKRWLQEPPSHRRAVNGTPQPEKLMRLDAIYKVGHIIKVAVQSKSGGTISLSAMPSMVNGNHTRESLKEGMVLQAAIASVEDYGYSIELALNDLAMAFVSADEFPGVMYVGQVFLVRVLKSHGGRLKFVPYKFEDDNPKSNDFNLNTITPGMVVEGTIVQSDENGLSLALMDGSVTGSVEPRQIIRGKDVSVNTKIRVFIMYKHPVLNTVYCSMRIPPVDPANPFKEFHGLALGQLVKKAVIVQVASTFVKLEVPIKNSGCSVFAAAVKPNISDNETADPSDVFSVGQVVACRITGMSLFESELYVSLRDSVVVDGCYYTEDELYVGRTLQAKVKYSCDTGIVFELCPGVTAFCDFTEASFVVNKSNVAEMYPVGKPVQVVIRYINGKHYPQRYFVTCNKKLVKSKHDIITQYSTGDIGKISDGIILMTKRRGLLVGFYNKVRAWVPEEYLPHSASRPDEVYRVGQVVTAKILNVTPEANRMTASLRCVDTDGPSAELAAGLDGACQEISSKTRHDFEVKTDLEGIVTNKADNWLELRVQGLGEGLLPENHLSDFSDLSNLLFENIKVGDKLQQLSTFGKSGGRTVLSMKPLVHSTFAGGGNVGKIGQNSVLPGVVKRVGSWGVVLSLPNDVSVRLLTRDLCDSFIPKDQLRITEGSTVLCKVTSARAPFTATCKKSAVKYNVDSSYNESLLTTIKKVLAFGIDDNIGKVVKVLPMKIDSEIICDFNGRRAVASASLTTDGQLVSGQPTNAIILGYRFNEGQREYVVTVDRDVVYKYLHVVRQSKKSNSKLSQKCKADVLLLAVLKDYAVSMTKEGRLLLLTLGNHFNDVRRAAWCSERAAPPKFIKAYIYEGIDGSIAVGNFCRSEGVPSIETHTVTKLSEESSKSDAEYKLLGLRFGPEVRAELFRRIQLHRGADGGDQESNENDFDAIGGGEDEDDAEDNGGGPTSVSDTNEELGSTSDAGAEGAADAESWDDEVFNEMLSVVTQLLRRRRH